MLDDANKMLDVANKMLDVANNGVFTIKELRARTCMRARGS